jgi:4,5-dihydroxyphthalate decarboxylase
MARLPLTLACGDYDRTRALATGEVPVEGVDLRYVALEPEEVFFRMVRHREFDVAELSLSTYLLTLGRGAPFIAIPVFPSRMFRHSGIYVHVGSGIVAPADLRGAEVGVAEYQLTANVWIRGILEDDYDVPVTSVHYRTGGLNQPGRVEKTVLALRPQLDVAPIPPGDTLSDLLAAGEIDAIYSPRAPDSFLRHPDRVRRLFADPRAEERRYYEQHHVFPIMHVVVLRRELYESNRWLARSLTKAFTEAKILAVERLGRTAALSVTLPWALQELEETRATLGVDYWPYGLEANRHTLEVFIRYSHAQGLAARPYEAEELFAPEALEDVVI